MLTVAYRYEGKQAFWQSSGEAEYRYGQSEPGESFTRYPLTLMVQHGQGEDVKLYGFRINHTPEGYAALKALGWDAPLPKAYPEREGSWIQGNEALYR